MTQTLTEDTHKFLKSLEAVRMFVPVDRQARRQLSLARRRLIRSLSRMFRALKDDQLTSLAEYLRLISA